MKKLWTLYQCVAGRAIMFLGLRPKRLKASLFASACTVAYRISDEGRILRLT